jgi:PAS domain S-box-containing protein
VEQVRRSRIFRRTFLTLVVLFGVIALLTSVLSAYTLYKRLLDEFVSKGVAVSRSIATSNVELLLSRDASTIQAMIDNYLEIRGLSYVYVEDDQGEIIAHTFVPAFPEELRAGPEFRRRQVNDIEVKGLGSFIDVGTPVLAGEAGYVHVGMDRSIILGFALRAILEQQVLLLFIFVGTVIVLYALVGRLVRPINRLTVYAERLAAHDFSARPDIDASDEIGMLARTMGAMAGEISEHVSALETNVAAATAELQETLAYMRSIIWNLGDGLLVTDTTGCITHSNPALSAMYGFHDADLTGKDVDLLFLNDLGDLAHRACEEQRVLHKAEVTLSRGRVGKAVGTSIHMMDEAGGSGGRCMGAVVLVRDITAEKEVDRMKTDFISTVSHELRTPLTSVLGFAKIISKRLENVIFPALKGADGRVLKVAGQVAENMHVIVSEGRRLTELINDVLDISKMESGKVEWRMQRENLALLIEQCVASTRALFDERGLACAMDLPCRDCEVVCDRDRMVQVLVNLLSNAVKFTPAGSVTVRLTRRGGGATVCVEDTGVGMSLADQEKVFERFKQVGDTLTEKPKGTGLGLAICKHIVEAHKGRIWVESEVGRGSRFYFSLPFEGLGESPRPAPLALAPEDFSMECAPRPAREGARRERPLILVVDDDGPMRVYLSQILQDEGFDTILAKDGFQALEMADTYLPDLLTMDIMMPGMDGRTAIQKLRRNERTRHIPVMVISALNLADMGGADVSLVKPVDEDQFLDILQGLLRGERIGNGACMVLGEKGRVRGRHLLMLCPANIEYCPPDLVWERIAGGFTGVVFVPFVLSAGLDLARLANQPDVQVVILPETCEEQE